MLSVSVNRVARAKYSNLTLKQFTTISSCRIPGCDIDGQTEYKPEWLSHAVPFVNGVPSRCTRYESSTTNSSQCWDENEFQHDNVVSCSDWVFETDERTILNEVNILCLT